MPQLVGVKRGDPEPLGELAADVLRAGNGEAAGAGSLLADWNPMNSAGEWSTRAVRYFCTAIRALSVTWTTRSRSPLASTQAARASSRCGRAEASPRSGPRWTAAVEQLQRGKSVFDANCARDLATGGLLGPTAENGSGIAWQAKRHQRGETDQLPAYTDNPFRPR